MLCHNAYRADVCEPCKNHYEVERQRVGISRQDTVGFCHRPAPDTVG
jgi:hypothetical protein